MPSDTLIIRQKSDGISWFIPSCRESVSRLVRCLSVCWSGCVLRGQHSRTNENIAELIKIAVPVRTGNHHKRRGPKSSVRAIKLIHQHHYHLLPPTTWGVYFYCTWEVNIFWLNFNLKPFWGLLKQLLLGNTIIPWVYFPLPPLGRSRQQPLNPPHPDQRSRFPPTHVQKQGPELVYSVQIAVNHHLQSCWPPPPPRHDVY